MFQFPGFQSSSKSALENEVKALRREVARMAGRAGRYGAESYGDARRGTLDLYGDMVDVVGDLLPFARKRAARVERLAIDNPAATAALVGLVVVGLVASIVYSRRQN